MDALVTGATGCVGANIVEALLARGYGARALRRATSRPDALAGLTPAWAVGDVLDEAALRAAMAGCAWVFHAAAVSQYWRSCPDEIYRVNVTGTRNVLRAAQACGVQRVILTSSVATLGAPTRPGQLLDETCDFNLHPTQFHYGHSKWLAEAEARRALAQGLDVVIVNPASVIGQRDVNFVGGAILRMVVRGVMVVAPPGAMGVVSGRAVGLGHVLAAERGRAGERYILNGENLSHRALLALMAAVTGSRAPWVTAPPAAIRWAARAVRLATRLYGRPLPVDAAQMVMSTRAMRFDGSKAHRELGFPRVLAREAVEEAWDWYGAHGGV